MIFRVKGIFWDTPFFSVLLSIFLNFIPVAKRVLSQVSKMVRYIFVLQKLKATEQFLKLMFTCNICKTVEFFQSLTVSRVFIPMGCYIPFWKAMTIGYLKMVQKFFYHKPYCRNRRKRLSQNKAFTLHSEHWVLIEKSEY